MNNDSPPTTERHPKTRSRVTNGKKLLPTGHSQSVWARLMSDTRDAMVAHLGGSDAVSETQALAVRRIAAFEAELIFLEDRFAHDTAGGWGA